MVKMAITTSVGSPVKAPSTQSTRFEVTEAIASKSQAKWSSSQLIACSTPLPILILGMGLGPGRVGQGAEKGRARDDPRQMPLVVDHGERTVQRPTSEHSSMSGLSMVVVRYSSMRHSRESAVAPRFTASARRSSRATPTIRRSASST